MTWRKRFVFAIETPLSECIRKADKRLVFALGEVHEITRGSQGSGQDGCFPRRMGQGSLFADGFGQRG